MTYQDRIAATKALRERRQADFIFVKIITEAELAAIDMEVKVVIERAKRNIGRSSIAIVPSEYISPLLNTVTFPDLDFAEAAGRYRRLPPVPPQARWVTWEDETPRTGISKDGVTLVMYLPGLNPPAAVVSDGWR